MRCRSGNVIIALIVLVLCLGFGAPSWSDVTGRPHDLSLGNPSGHCLNCHDLHQTGLGEGYPHNLKRANEIAVCYQCHAGALNDYSSIDPSYPDYNDLLSGYDIRAEFEQAHIHFERYGMDGEHNLCSHCHNPHGVFDPTSTTRLPKLLSAGPDGVTDTDEYCFVCHNSDASPPHLPFPNISVGAQFRFSRLIYNDMTHSTFFRATTVTEPVPDTAMTYDDNPYGAGKDISCLTCHHPHGSANEHMLNSPDDETFCLSCHDGTRAGDLSEFDVSGHGKTGVDRICQECHFPHGTGQENAVKTVITDPHTDTDNPADVKGAGMNEACFACHGTDHSEVYSNSFDSSASGWYNSNLTTSWDGSVGRLATGSLKQVVTTAGDRFSYSGEYAVQPGVQYSMLGYLYLPQDLPGTGSRLRVIEYNASNVVTADKSSSSTTSTSGGWLLKTFTLTTEPATVKVRLRLNTNDVGTAYWDEVMFTATPYFTGRSDYAASIHKNSTSVHNPADTGGDQEPGDCGNCHEPHGTANDGMLLDPDESLCYDCHNASTPNTVSGDDVQAAFQMASHHDLGMVGCTDCHNVHTATQSVVMMSPHNRAGALTDTNSFCLGCHAGLLPAGVTGAPDISWQWTGGGHDTTHVLKCSDCHEPHGSPNPNNLNYRTLVVGPDTAGFTSGMSFTSRSFCEVCHDRSAPGFKGAAVIPTGAGFVGQHDQADATPCSDCHSLMHDPKLANYTGGSSYYSVACLECHTQGVGNPYPDTDAQFNTPAVPLDADTRRSVHDVVYRPYSSTPVAECTACHGADHESDHDGSSMIVDPDPFNGFSTAMPAFSASTVFCLECHDTTPVSIGGATPRDIMDTYTAAGHGTAEAGLLCAQCHVHHGSFNEMLIRGTINGKQVLGTYSGNNVSVCTACHQGMDANMPQWPGFGVYSGSIHAFGNMTTGNLVTDGRHGAGTCSNCHDPHGEAVDGEKTHSMARKNEEELCYTCHASGFDNFSTPGDYNDKWTRLGNTAPVAKKGGALHVGRIVVDAATDVLDGLVSTAAYPDKDSEISIKLKVAEITRTDGVAQFGIGIYDPRSTGDYVNLFYRGHSDPRNWIVRFTGDGGVYGTIPLFGDEDKEYHTLKLVRRTTSGEVDAYIDDTLIDTCPFSTSGYFKVKLFFNLYGSDATPETMDLWFDEFQTTFQNGVNPYNTASGDDVQARFYMKSHHNVSDEDQLGHDGLPGTDDDSKVECEDCHDPHTVTASLMAYRNVSGTVEPIEADQEFCIKCHDSDPQEGVVYPAEGVWDKSDYLNSAHGNDLMRDKVFGNYSNGVVYPCKVCHNPHGSEQAYLQRESWDIDRDGIPDDIDGDGILDSSTLVGFIGYSTGTRKVILVDSPRAGFARISSTIPYQANGTIDVELCFNCHDGTPAPDVETDFYKRSHHDVTYADQQASGGSRIECYNCHDQHTAQFPNYSAGQFATTDPFPPRTPMPPDAPFCLRCHDLTLPPGLSFGTQNLKNIKLSYNPMNKMDGDGYDILSNYTGHYRLSDGRPLMCRECHNQHGSDYEYHIRDNTESAKPGYDPSQPVQEIVPLALRASDPYSGGDTEPLSTTSERCLACHSGGTTYEGGLIPLPPPPDDRGFALPPVGKHPDVKASVTVANETGGHIYSAVFSVITTPGSIKETCVFCHDSHNPYISTLSGELMACYQCHNENTSLPDTQSEFNDNPTNPTRSRSYHPIFFNPTSTGPDAVECLKCHDQSRHMQGVVRLRKDPSAFDNYTSDADVWADPIASGTINQFCLECHDPDTTVEANFTENGTHVPPKLPADFDSGVHFTDGGLFCTDCHEYHGSVNLGLRKNEFGEEESFCYGCHNNPANSMGGIDIEARFSMGESHDVDDAVQASSGSAIECEDCHNPHTVTRSEPVVHADDADAPVASDDSFCLGCHDSDGAAGVKFPGYSTGTGEPEWDSSSGAWNRWNKEAYAGSGHQAQGFGCQDCHDPHGSPNYANLLQNISGVSGISVGFGLHSTARGGRTEEIGVNGVCSACHQGVTGVYGGYAAFTSLTFGNKHGLDKNCTYCHNPHGTPQAGMLRSDKPLNMDMGSAEFGSVYNFKGFGNQTTGAPYYTFCNSRGCHAAGNRAGKDMLSLECEPDTYMDDLVGSSHHPIKEGVIGCTSCHNEHGSVNEPDLRAPYFREDNWPVLFKSGIGVYDTYRPYGYGEQFLGSDVNYFERARSGLPDNTNRNKITTVNPPDDANDLCFMCHQKDDIIGTSADGMANTNTKFLGHEVVEGGATISHNISRNGSGIGTDYHNFSCSACHLPHSIGRPKLMKQGCFSQSDGQTPYTGSYTNITVGACHAYNGWGSTWAAYGGWRNLTTAAKTDFSRPLNAVDDLDITIDADLTVHLDWTAVEDDPGQGADHYNVYRSDQYITQATKPYATRFVQGFPGAGTGTPMTWTDFTGQPDTTYYYAVVACDAENNESLVSNCVVAPLGADMVDPAAISDQSTLQAGGTYYVKLRWHDPGDNVNVTEYRVYRLNNLSTLTGAHIVPDNRIATVADANLSADGSPDTDVHSFTDYSTVFGQQYTYAVVSADAAGNVSTVPTGVSFSVTIDDPAPGEVEDLTAVPVSREMKAQLDWTAPINIGAISGYNVYRKDGSALTQADIDLGDTYRIADMLPGTVFTNYSVPAVATDYFYTVTAVDESSGKESAIGNVEMVNIPAPPAGLTVEKLFDGDLRVNWDAPAYTDGLESYNIYSRGDGGAWSPVGFKGNIITNGSFEAGLSGWTPSGDVSATDGNFVTDGRYSVKMKSASTMNYSMYSDMFSGGVEPSTQFRFSADVFIPVNFTSGITYVRIYEYNSSGGSITSYSCPSLTTTGSQWTTYEGVWTTNSQTAQMRVYIYMQGVGTVYWDNLRLLPVPDDLTGPVTADLSGLEPGCDIAVTADYGSYGGSTPYESVMSGMSTITMPDTVGPEFFNVTGVLTYASGYDSVGLSWTAPQDLNFAGYSSSGVDHYRVEATYDRGKTWGTLFSSRLTNPSLGLSSGTVDDSSVDNFTDWNTTSYNTYAYGVTDALFDGTAVRIKYDGSGDAYIYSAEPNTVSVDNKAYSLSFWAKANKDTDFEYFIKANGGNNETIGVTTSPIGTDWQRFTTSDYFSPSATATSAAACIRPSTSDTTAEITIDGVRLETSNAAIQATDGSFYQPPGYNTPGSPQSFDDQAVLTAGTSTRYRVRAVDAEFNFSDAADTGYIPAKPSAITDLLVSSSDATSANILKFGSSRTRLGISEYRIYAKEQGTELNDVTGATLIGTVTPQSALDDGYNMAPKATATEKDYYSTSYPPASATDENESTFWIGSSNSTGWLSLDFGETVSAYKVSFSFYGSTGYQPSDFEIQTSDDGVDWTTTVEVTGNTQQYPTYTFEEPVETRHVRIFITNTRGGIPSYRPYIYEFRVYGGQKFAHDLQNAALRAEPGHTYAYAVIAEDLSGFVSDISSGPVTVNALLDKDPPDKVNDLALTSPVGTTQAILSWSTPLDNLGYGSTTGATGYEVYQLPTSVVGTPEAVTDDNFATASLVYSGSYATSLAGTFNNYTASWYDHEGVYYAVRSADAAGNWSPISNSPFITVGKDVEAPTPPVITNCVPVATPEVDVYWEPATDNIGINGYRLFRADVDTEPFATDQCITENNVDQAEIALNLIPYDSDSASDSGGTPGTTYYYALRAWDDANNMSNISNCAVATVRTAATDTTPPVWSNATSLTAIQQPYPDIDLVWDPATDEDDAAGAGTIDHYDIYRSLSSFTAKNDPGVTKLATVSGVRHSYIDNTGSHETSYYYGLVAVDASAGANESALSNVVSVTVAVAPSPDNTPPTVPGSLAVATGVYPYLNLSWTGSTDVDDGANPQQLLYYKLYRSDYPLDITDANKDNADQVKTFFMANDATAYVATGMGDAMYNYRLEAFDLVGNPSGLSNQVTGTVASAPCVDTTAPYAPADLAAVVGPSPDIDLSWTASTDNGGGCTGVIDHYSLYKADYEITVSTDLRSLSHIHVAGNSTSYVDSSGEPNKQYWYVLTAVDSSGNESGMSNIITRTTAADTMAPAAVADLNAEPDTGSALLTWCRPSDNVGIDHYEIYRKEQGTILMDADIIPANSIGVLVNGGVCLSYNDTGALSGHTYSYAVIAVDGAGNRSTISRGESAGDTIIAMP